MFEELFEIVTDIIAGIVPLVVIGTVVGKSIKNAKTAAEEQKAKRAGQPQPAMPNWGSMLPKDSMFFPSQPQVAPVAQQPEYPAQHERVENLHAHVPVYEYETHEVCEIDEDLRLVSDSTDAVDFADATNLNVQRLRLAVIWSEVLDKPLALRKTALHGRR